MNIFSRGFEQEYWELAMARAEVAAQRVAKRCESPIEITFAVAYCMAIRLWRDIPIIFGGLEEGEKPPKDYYYLWPQHQIGKHRVDFLAGISGNAAAAIIECDGRDFHHSTREQIERDRERDAELQNDARKVFRFPGTQVHNNPFSCVVDVLNWLDQRDVRS